jgi:hypothetical protein
MIMETIWTVISILGGGIVIALLLFFFLVIKSHKKKKVSKNTNESTPPQTAPSQGGRMLDNIKKIKEEEWFGPLVLALGLIAAIGIMNKGLPWWGFLMDNGAGTLVLFVVLIAGTIVYKKKAVPVLFVLLLISLGCYFGPKMTVAREGPKSTAQVGFFDGEMQLKAGQWSQRIFIKGGFEMYCPPGIIYSLEINGTREVQWDGNGRLFPLNEGIIRSLRIKSPVDTMMTFTQLTK